MTNGNEPAFSKSAFYHPDGGIIDSPQEGLSKREYFAAMALQGLLSDSNNTGNCAYFATDAVKMADALIEQLNKAK